MEAKAVEVKIPVPWGCAGCSCATTQRSIVFRTLVAKVNETTNPPTIEGYEADAKVSTYGWCGQLSCLVKIGERIRANDLRHELVLE